MKKLQQIFARISSIVLIHLVLKHPILKCVEVHIQENERIVRAEWFRQPLSPLAKDEDDIYLVIHDTKEQDTLAYPLGKRGVPGTKEFPLHKDFTPANCVAYAFVLSPVNTRASVSKYTNIILE